MSEVPLYEARHGTYRTHTSSLAYAEGPMVVPGGWTFLMREVPL